VKFVDPLDCAGSRLKSRASGPAGDWLAVDGMDGNDRMPSMRPALVIVLSLLWPSMLIAAERGPVGLPCKNPSTAARNGSYELEVGAPVTLKDSGGCIPDAVETDKCEWSMSVTRLEQWGPQKKFLLIIVGADHETGTGAWGSVFVYVCRGESYVQVFDDRFLYNGDVQLGKKSDFQLTSPQWNPGDSTCCPSHERRIRYGWNEKQQDFVKLSSTIRRLPPR